jgi:site-specific recombinase
MNVFSMPAFWMAVAGIVVIGIMNVGVSFFLALFVALKARRIRAPMREEIYSAVAARFRKQPLSFFLAPPSAAKAGISH